MSSSREDQTLDGLETPPLDPEPGCSPGPSEGVAPGEKGHDPDLVDWDGPNDSANPRNWTMKKKVANIALVSFMVFVVPLASSMFAPGIEEVMLEFRSDNQLIAAFVVSVFVLGFAFGPVMLAPLSEVFGRLRLYWSCNLLFFVFSILCAKAGSMGQLIAFRFLCGFFGGLPLAVGGGTITDVMDQEDRGFAMAIFGAGPMMGPVAGPIIGGFLSQAKGWRWVFWLLAILSGVSAVLTFLLMSETYAPVILQRKVDRLKKETGNQNLHSALDPNMSAWLSIKHSLLRPAKLLILSPAVIGLSLFQAFCFGCLYLIFTTFTMVYQDVYHWSIGLQGLSFIPMGLGSVFGTIIFGLTSDRILKWKASQNGGEMKPEYRLYPLVPAAFGIPIGLFWYGWAAQAHTHWVVPILGTFFIGIGFFFCMVTIISYVMDAYTEYSASAVASVAVIRSVFGGVLPLAGRQMYVKMGYGWGSSLLGFISIALLPVPFIFYKYGQMLREKYPVKLK